MTGVESEQQLMSSTAIAPNCTESVLKPFHWTPPRTEAALLVADDKLSNHEIAAKVGVAKRTLQMWIKLPAFAARVAENAAKFCAEVTRNAIARVDGRLAAMDDRWSKMNAVIAERGADPDYAKAPGGKTGLLVRKEKSIGSGEGAKVVEEFSLDTGLLDSLLDAEKAAKEEVERWEAKRNGRTLADPNGDWTLDKLLLLFKLIDEHRGRVLTERKASEAAPLGMVDGS